MFSFNKKRADVDRFLIDFDAACRTLDACLGSGREAGAGAGAPLGQWPRYLKWLLYATLQASGHAL